MAKIAFGKRVTPEFIASVHWIAKELEVGNDPIDGTNILMGVMGWESGGTFSSAVKNMAGSGATGLIQFMPNTAISLKTTVAKLAAMSPVKQLSFVYKYFKPYKGKLKTLSDVYMAVLWPKGVGKPEDYVLWEKGKSPKTFRQNAGLDVNKDGRVTKRECAAKVTAKLKEGLLAKNAADWTPEPELPLTSKEEVVVKEYPVAGAPDWQKPTDILKDVAADAGAAARNAVTETIAQATEAAPPTVLDKVKDAAGSKAGSFAGVAAIAGAVLLNPDFTSALSGFVINLAKGDGSWGALLTLAGAALVAFKPKPDPG